MPFDALPDIVVSDLVKLKVALAGISKRWEADKVGLRGSEQHCAVGWLLVASDWDEREATRLALKYVYPSLPKRAQHPERKVWSVSDYNDDHSHEAIVQVFEAAVKLAADATG